jgi:hypothetical protein
MAELIVVTEAPEGMGTVVPACPVVHAGRVGGVHGLGVVSPSGNVAGNPALVQFMAREEDSTFDHDWAHNGAVSTIANARRKSFFIPM